MKVGKKTLTILMAVALCFPIVTVDIKETDIQHTLSSAQVTGEFSPTHRADIDLWVRNNVPFYSLRTGDWVLGQQIGLIRIGTRIQIKQRRIIGMTQSWLEVLYQLPDGRIVGGEGHWIWAGRRDTEENITPLQDGSKYLPAREDKMFSLVGTAWAQGDSVPARGYSLPDTNREKKIMPQKDNKESILDQLGSWQWETIVYSGVYVALLLGMLTGSIWERIGGDSTQPSKGNRIPPRKLFLRVLVGSIISFSFFLGPVMGIGEIGLSISSIILAFHFGLAHSDPQELLLNIRRRHAVTENTG